MADPPEDVECLSLQNFDSHAKYLCRYMNKLYKKNKYTDVVLRCGSSDTKSLSCHRLVLCAFSDYVTNVLKSVNNASIFTLDLEDSAGRLMSAVNMFLKYLIILKIHCNIIALLILSLLMHYCRAGCPSMYDRLGL